MLAKLARLKVHLIPIFFLLKPIYWLFEILLGKKFLDSINPRFSVPRRNLENSPKTSPFCFASEFEENESSGCVTSTQEGWISQGFSFQSHFLEVGAIHIRKVRRNAFHRCYRLCSNIPDLKKDLLYNLPAMIG